ncbi:MAG: hypothetical protein HDR01_15345 [Lachnospiraceae bacterium]|nr:hypothetical protein [Lachnospiraceae bacterium]
MRVSGLNSSLLGYMYGGSSSYLSSLYGGSSNSFLSSLYGASRTSSMFGTKIASTYGSYGTNLSRYGSNYKTYNNITSYYDKMAYNYIKSGAEGVRNHAETLNQTGEDSVFGKAEATGNTKEAVYEINQFVENYNSMLTNMKKVGGSIQSIYGKQFATQTVIHKDALSKIGITASTDGTLSVNQSVLKEASIDDMKKVFQGTSSFAGQASVKSIYVESSAASSLSGNKYASNSPYGSSYLGYNSYGGYSANSFGSLFNSYFNSYF